MTAAPESVPSFNELSFPFGKILVLFIYYGAAGVIERAAHRCGGKNRLP
jgi:hypothetical protein